MKKLLKKGILSLFSLLGLSVLFWIVVMLHPGIVYANSTQFGQVTVYHDQPLEAETGKVLENALAIMKKSDLYREDISIQLCLNDGSFYPELHPLRGGLAYAFLNKSVIYGSKPDFAEGTSSFQWKINHNELRKADLTWLLAHEFTHNLQWNLDWLFVMKYDFWKGEGYAEYISRQWQNDGKLREKIQQYEDAKNQKHKGIPVFILNNGTIQTQSYFQYAIMTQYLIEQQGMDWDQICKDERTMDEVYSEMLAWKNNPE